MSMQVIFLVPVLLWVIAWSTGLGVKWLNRRQGRQEPLLMLDTLK